MEWLKAVLSDEKRICEIIVSELKEIKEKFGDERRTKLTGDLTDIDDEDLIAREPMVVTMTASGTIKRIHLDEYRLQRRGRQGPQGT